MNFFKILNIVSNHVQFSLSAKYRGSILGFLWSFLNPFLIIITISFVFGNLFNKPLFDYFLLVSAGMIPWLIFSNSLTMGCRSLINNESVLRKLYVPKFLFPLSSCVSIFIEYILIIIFFIAFVSYVNGFNYSYLFVFLTLSLYFIFIFSVVLSISVLTVFFRDLENIIVALVQVLFFLTPILYDKTSLLKGLDTLVLINPLTYFIEGFKNTLLYGLPPDFNLTLIMIFVSFCFSFATFIFYKLSYKKIVFSL